MKHQCPAARCTLRSLSRAKAMAKGGVTQNAPAEGEANAPDIAALKIDFFGQRPGLIDLPHISVVELTGDEFGVGLRYLELAKQADKHLRNLQGKAGLINLDTGWMLRINGKGRKKMGDNADQSVFEIKAVAGIDRLARIAIVAERHLDERHKNPDVIAVLRLYAPLLLDGVMYRVRLTVKDYDAPRMLHALSAIEIENAPLGILPSYSSSDLLELQKAQPTTGRIISISDLLKTAILGDGKLYDHASERETTQDVL